MEKWIYKKKKPKTNKKQTKKQNHPQKTPKPRIRVI